jgi:hypothetical protein
MYKMLRKYCLQVYKDVKFVTMNLFYIKNIFIIMGHTHLGNYKRFSSQNFESNAIYGSHKL